MNTRIKELGFPASQRRIENDCEVKANAHKKSVNSRINELQNTNMESDVDILSVSGVVDQKKEERVWRRETTHKKSINTRINDLKIPLRSAYQLAEDDLKDGGEINNIQKIQIDSASNGASSCLKAILGISIFLNIALAGSGTYLIWQIFASSVPGSLPPIPRPPDIYNGSCKVYNLSSDSPQIDAYNVDVNKLNVCWSKDMNDINNRGHALLVDNWYNLDSSFKEIYIGRGRSVSVHNLLPGVPYTYKVCPRSKDGIVNCSKIDSNAILRVTTSNTTCGNFFDMDIYRHANDNDLIAKIRSCAIKHTVPSEIKSCIIQKTGLSRPCASCWQTERSCIEKHCLSAGCLLEPTSAKCSKCVDASCLPAIANCTGLPMWAYFVHNHQTPPSGVSPPDTMVTPECVSYSIHLL